ncbi:MAG: MmgE/PrpD family protein [Ramlibacter sp.]|jgi:aconitate decarboxylase|nr:MmgE/PrpD family protein [Ramlibacter sp.]
MGLTSDLGAFVAALKSADVPAAAVPAVRRGMADCVGVAFASVGEPVLAHALATVASADTGEARLWTESRFASAADAAFVNAVAGHALDFDDTGLDGHPSVVLAPVVLAQAQRLGKSWQDAVTAYVAGYEVWAELVSRDQDKHHGKGWHPTAVFGAVASAAASAWLRGLSAECASHAIGIAASMAGGLVANFGSMTKPLQVGFAARNGIFAAALAERGVTATVDALESPRGFLAALSPKGRVRLDGPCLAGAPWQILQQGLNVKRYPACYATHRIIDAALSLRPQVPGAADIEEVVAEMGELQLAMLRSSRPQTALDAKFSAEFTIACALARGHVDLHDLTDASVQQADVQQLLRKVRLVAVPQRDSQEPLFSPADVLTVRLRDGTALQAQPVQRALGHATRPIGEAELREKFIACATAAMDAAGADRWWNAAMAPLQAQVRWP